MAYIRKKKVQKFFAMTQKLKDAYAGALEYFKKEYELSVFEKDIISL